MKTIEETAKNYVEKNIRYDTEDEKKMCIEIYTDGYKYAQRWIPFEYPYLPPNNKLCLFKDIDENLYHGSMQYFEHGDSEISLYGKKIYLKRKFQNCEGEKMPYITIWRPIELK